MGTVTGKKTLLSSRKYLFIKDELCEDYKSSRGHHSFPSRRVSRIGQKWILEIRCFEINPGNIDQHAKKSRLTGSWSQLVTDGHISRSI